jgi:hypothetical protein
MIIIGAEIRSGEYQGNSYCNVMLYGTKPTKEGVGSATEFAKIKHSRLCEILGKNVDNKELEKLIGEKVDFGYDKWQNVNFITKLPKE